MKLFGCRDLLKMLKVLNSQGRIRRRLTHPSWLATVWTGSLPDQRD